MDKSCFCHGKRQKILKRETPHFKTLASPALEHLRVLAVNLHLVNLLSLTNYLQTCDCVTLLWAQFWCHHTANLNTYNKVFKGIPKVVNSLATSSVISQDIQFSVRKRGHFEVCFRKMIFLAKHSTFACKYLIFPKSYIPNETLLVHFLMRLIFFCFWTDMFSSTKTFSLNP